MPTQAARRPIANRAPLTCDERPSRGTGRGSRRWVNGEAAEQTRYLASDIQTQREVEAQQAGHPGPLLKFQGRNLKGRLVYITRGFFSESVSGTVKLPPSFDISLGWPASETKGTNEECRDEPPAKIYFIKDH